MKINDDQVRRALRAARKGRALGLDARHDDFDAKNTPRAVLGSKLSQILVTLGLTLDDVGMIDVFAWDTFRPFVSGLRSGIRAPSEIAYLRACNYVAANPLHLKKILVRGSDAGVVADTELSIVRRTPFGSSESERIALASFITPDTQQTNIVEVPIECEIDGASFVRAYIASYGIPAIPGDPLAQPPVEEVPAVLDDKTLSLTFFFDRVAERRSSL